jgi:hypothetical protein
MSTVLGNDYVPPSTFERFFAHGISVPKRKSLCPRHRAISGLLAWLGRENNCEEAVARILQTIPASRREDLKIKIAQSMAMYNVDETVIESTKSLEGVSQWLLDEHRSANIPAWTLDILCNREVFFQSQVEHVAAPASHVLALPAFRRLAALLFTAKEAGLPAEVKLFTRRGRSVQPVILNLTVEDTCGKVLRDLREAANEDKEAFVLATAALSAEEKSFVEEAPPHLRLFLAALSWWSKDERIVQADLDAFVAVLTLQHVVGNLDLPLDSEIADKDSTVIAQERDEAAAALKRLRARWPQGAPQARRGNPHAGDALDFTKKKLSPFQAKLYHLSVLAKLLKATDIVPDVTKLLDGTAMANARADLVGDGSKKLDMSSVVGSSASATAYCSWQLPRQVCDPCPSGDFKSCCPKEDQEQESGTSDPERIGQSIRVVDR